MTSVWSVDLCRDWQRIGTVTAFEFHGVERFLEAGEWSLECAAEAVDWGSTYDSDLGRYVQHGPEDVNTIRLVRDKVIVFAGYVAVVSEGVGGLVISNDGSGLRFQWSGPDLWDLLKRRVAYPNPAADPPWGASHDVETGAASTVVAAYLNANMGVGSLPDRTVDGFAVDDQQTGMVGEWSARLQPLSDLVARICTDAELGCWLTIDWDGRVTATVGAPRNLADRYIFSDQGDLTNVQVRHVPASVTWTLAGGQGEGTSRVFRVASSGEAGAARREVFSDQSSLSSFEELLASASANTRLGGRSWSVYGEVADETAAALRYGSDLRLGDLVTIEVLGRRYVVPVTSAAIEVTAERRVVRPTLGTASPDELKGLIRDVANLAARFNRDIA